MAALIKKAYVDTSYGQLHYRYAIPPEPKDILIFLHMSATSSACWIKLLEYYSSKGYACYAFDMPGFGASFDPSVSAIEEISAKGTRWYVDLYMTTFTAIGFERFHLIGHHTGASLSMEMAAIYSKFVKSICLIGASVLPAEERAKMREKYFDTFNQPVSSGSHLQKTWYYLGELVTDNIEMYQQNVLDHIRAWKGRNQVYGAIWSQDKEEYFSMVQCPAVAMCARDDVLWPYFGNMRKIRPDVPTVEIKGGNFSPERDVDGVIKELTPLLVRSS